MHLRAGTLTGMVASLPPSLEHKTHLLDSKMHLLDPKDAPVLTINTHLTGMVASGGIASGMVASRREKDKTSSHITKN